MGKPLLVKVIDDSCKRLVSVTLHVLVIGYTVIDCGVLEPPANGAVNMSQGSLLGAMATYMCDPSHTLVGPDLRQCQENGMWSGETPICEGMFKKSLNDKFDTLSIIPVVVCPILEDPQFGSISYENGNRGIGSMATYTCDPRYSLVGNALRTCLDTSEWSGRAPTCECK